MWTVARGVELKSFKAFDDGVITFEPIFNEVISTSVSNVYIQFSFETQTIEMLTEMSHVVIGIIKHENMMLIFMKNISAITVRSVSALSSSKSDEVFSLQEACSAFFFDATPLFVLFGLRDGSVINFSFPEKQFSVVDPFGPEVIIALCRSENYVAILNEVNTVNVLDLVSGKQIDSFTANLNGATCIACSSNRVLTGGQYGKVYVRRIETGEMRELVDQAQAHKRKVIALVTSRNYIYSCSSDQKVKQWSLNDFKLIASFTMKWIPTGLWVSNGSVIVGGPSTIFMTKLKYYDTIDKITSFSSLPDGISRRGGGVTSNSDQLGGNSQAIVIVAILIAVLLLGTILFFIYRRQLRKNQSFKKDEPLSDFSESSLIATQTLVTSFLKISIPGYKELTPLDFRIIKKLAQGGGGHVYLAEALSLKCSKFGNIVVVKKTLCTCFDSTANCSRNGRSESVKTTGFSPRDCIDGVF
jgi:WD40 repeat protein